MAITRDTTKDFKVMKGWGRRVQIKQPTGSTTARSQPQLTLSQNYTHKLTMKMTNFSIININSFVCFPVWSRYLVTYLIANVWVDGIHHKPDPMLLRM